MNDMSLPRVSFAGRQISRMLLGGNPFSGFGHHPNDPDYDRCLREYFTDEKINVCENEQLTAETFRTIPTQMVAIKVLAAGRLPPAEAFRYAARTLKPTDLMTVGMRDYEVAENVRLAAAAFKEVGK